MPDSSSPVTTIIVDDPKIGSNPIKVTSNTKFHLYHNSDAGGVGVAFSWYKLNDGAPKTYVGPFTVPAGTTAIEWGSEDFMGNNETGNSMDVFVDNTPPVTNINFHSPNQGNDPVYIKSTTSITLTHNDDGDDGVGVEYRWYNLNGTSFHIFSSYFNAPSGTTYIEWGSVDKLGNNETGNSISVYVDDAPPITTLHVEGLKYGDDPLFITTSTIFTLTHNNDGDGVGVEESWYRLSGRSRQTYTQPFTAISGTTFIEWGSKDIFGNWETGNSISVVVDEKPPLTTLDIGKPKYSSYPTYVTTSTLFTLNDNDDTNGAGINYTWYRLNEGNVKNYNEPFTVPEGTSSIEWGSVDFMNNHEENKSISIHVDDTAPISTIGIDGEHGGINPTYVLSFSRFAISVNENGSGIYNTYYKIDDDENWTIFSSPFKVSSQGPHTIYYYSIDNLKNIESNKAFNIIVDDYPPNQPILDPIQNKTHEERITITGSAKPNCTIEIFIEDELVAFGFSSENGRFEIDILLSRGDNNITVYATDKLNRTSPSTPMITIDYKKQPRGREDDPSGIIFLVILIIIIIVVVLLFLYLQKRRKTGEYDYYQSYYYQSPASATPQPAPQPAPQPVPQTMPQPVPQSAPQPIPQPVPQATRVPIKKEKTPPKAEPEKDILEDDAQKPDSESAEKPVSKQKPSQEKHPESEPKPGIKTPGIKNKKSSLPIKKPPARAQSSASTPKKMVQNEPNTKPKEVKK
jgi:hypothetical protein